MFDLHLLLDLLPLFLVHLLASVLVRLQCLYELPLLVEKVITSTSLTLGFIPHTILLNDELINSSPVAFIVC